MTTTDSCKFCGMDQKENIQVGAYRMPAPMIVAEKDQQVIATIKPMLSDETKHSIKKVATIIGKIILGAAIIPLLIFLFWCIFPGIHHFGNYILTSIGHPITYDNQQGGGGPGYCLGNWFVGVFIIFSPLISYWLGSLIMSVYKAHTK